MSVPAADISVYTDFQGLSQLQGEAKADPSKAVGKVAKQFEALFFQMMLKSMRQAKLSDGLFKSDQMKTYQQMFDRQVALNLADGHSLGIADMLVKQMGGKTGGTSDAAPASLSTPAPPPGPGDGDMSAFVRTLGTAALQAAKQTGADPKVLLARAGLTTGWGKAVPSGADGRASHNLFGVKADPSWQGATVTVPSLVQQGSGVVKGTTTYRAYGSYEESFADYGHRLAAGSGAGTGGAAGERLASVLGDPQFNAAVAALKNS